MYFAGSTPVGHPNNLLEYEDGHFANTVVVMKKMNNASLTRDDLARAFEVLENTARYYPPALIYSYLDWKRGWNRTFPHLAFSEEELQAGLSHDDGFLGWRTGAKCYIEKLLCGNLVDHPNFVRRYS